MDDRGIGPKTFRWEESEAREKGLLLLIDAHVTTIYLARLAWRFWTWHEHYLPRIRTLTLQEKPKYTCIWL